MIVLLEVIVSEEAIPCQYQRERVSDVDLDRDERESSEKRFTDDEMYDFSMKIDTADWKKNVIADALVLGVDLDPSSTRRDFDGRP